MALTDVVFDKNNSSLSNRGNTGVINDITFKTGITVMYKSGIMYRYNGTIWEIVPIRYYSSDGWVL